MKSLFYLSALIAVSLLISGCGDGSSGAGQNERPALPVSTASPFVKTVALTETFTGRFVPVEEVDL